MILELNMIRREGNLIVAMEKGCSHVGLDNDRGLMKWKEGKLLRMLITCI